MSLDLGRSKSTKISQNIDRIENNTFEIDELKEKFSNRNEDYKKLEEELDDNRNRGFRKTLIFKNILVQQQRESWAESENILAKEIHTLMPNLELEYILSKIERAHRAKGSKHTKVPPIIAKFNDWHFTEMIETSAIKAKSSLYVSQMFSPAFTIRRNKAMLARKKLREHDKTTQAYVKYSEKLMVKKPYEREYSLLAEY